MINLKDKKVLLTGAGSLISTQIYHFLVQKYAHVIPTHHKDVDLLHEEEVLKLFEFWKPDYVIHAAGFNGGLQFNLAAPALIFERTTRMGMNVMNAARIYKVEKLLNLLTSCSYPSLTIPLTEKLFMTGEPDATVACHAYAKRNLFLYGRLLYQQYGFKVVNVIFNNAFGIGARYNEPNRLKVADALIKKICDAKRTKQGNVEVWGTGNARRELLYCKDAGAAAVIALQEYDDTTTPINMGTGVDYSIKEIAETIKRISGYTGELVFNATKPEGQQRKILDVTKMHQWFTWRPKYSLEEGIKETVVYYNALST